MDVEVVSTKSKVVSSGYATAQTISGAVLAHAPRNHAYDRWREKYSDPVAAYKNLRPTETAAEQCQLYVAHLITGRDVKMQHQLCLHIAQNFSPIVVPQEAWLAFPPLVRRPPIGARGQPPYVRAEIRWKGEWIDLGSKTRSKPWYQLEYTARIHTNTRTTVGEPPSIVIERRYPDRVPGVEAPTTAHLERLIAPHVKTTGLQSEIAGQICYDASGNAWISESGFQEASLNRNDPRLGKDARLILQGTHHPFWKEKLWNER